MAQSVALVAVEGVLRKPGTQKPIAEGFALYRALCEQYTVMLAPDAGTDEDLYGVEGWIEEHGLSEHSAFVDYRGDSRLDHANSLRRQGYALDLVVDSDPANIEQLYRAGFTAMLFLHPSYARPEHRPDHKSELPSWDSLVDAVRTEKLLFKNNYLEDEDE